jgi:hypothetical protein
VGTAFARAQVVSAFASIMASVGELTRRSRAQRPAIGHSKKTWRVSEGSVDSISVLAMRERRVDQPTRFTPVSEMHVSCIGFRRSARGCGAAGGAYAA